MRTERAARLARPSRASGGGLFRSDRRSRGRGRRRARFRCPPAATAGGLPTGGASEEAILVTSADADQLLVDELICAVAAELASETGALGAAEGQFRAICTNNVHIDHAGVDSVC